MGPLSVCKVTWIIDPLWLVFSVATVTLGGDSLLEAIYKPFPIGLLNSPLYRSFETISKVLCHVLKFFLHVLDTWLCRLFNQSDENARTFHESLIPLFIVRRIRLETDVKGVTTRFN